MKETLLEIFRRDPNEALETLFASSRAKNYLRPEDEDRAFMYTSLMGNHGQYRYGSYKVVKRSDLEGRQYTLEYMDGGLSIFWTDVVHDPKTYTSIPK